jgi:hypothetical protein
MKLPEIGYRIELLTKVGTVAMAMFSVGSAIYKLVSFLKNRSDDTTISHTD